MPEAPSVPLPLYGRRSLAELLPSLLGSLGLRGFENRLGLPPARRICLLLIDGLGWELLKANRAAAPFLNTLGQDPITAGFPATTAASLSMVATGLPPGQHGLIGYTMAVPGYDRALNALTWSLYGLGRRTDLRDELVPEQFQPLSTLAQEAAEEGLVIHHLGPGFHAGSGLTRAIGRGERFHPADSLEQLSETALALLGAPKALVYGYHPGLDTAGHVNGVNSQVWRSELTNIDNTVRMLAERLPAGTNLVVTGDHGMVDLAPEERLDLADHKALEAGVKLLTGEARARYVTTVPGAAHDVFDAWRAMLGDRMWLWNTEEAIAIGLFGETVTEVARARMGDIVAAAHGRVGIVQRDVDPAQARLNGHHGSLTREEQIVPLLLFKG